MSTTHKREISYSLTLCRIHFCFPYSPLKILYWDIQTIPLHQMRGNNCCVLINYFTSYISQLSEEIPSTFLGSKTIKYLRKADLQQKNPRQCSFCRRGSRGKDGDHFQTRIHTTAPSLRGTLNLNIAHFHN